MGSKTTFLGDDICSSSIDRSFSVASPIVHLKRRPAFASQPFRTSGKYEGSWKCVFFSKEADGKWHGELKSSTPFIRIYRQSLWQVKSGIQDSKQQKHLLKFIWENDDMTAIGVH